MKSVRVPALQRRDFVVDTAEQNQPQRRKDRHRHFPVRMVSLGRGMMLGGMKVGSFFGKRLSTKRLGWLGVLTLAAGARGECLSTVESAGSRCSIKTAGIAWLNRPASPQPVEKTGSSYDRLLADPALESGVWVEGPARFRLSLHGPHLIEVFVWVADQGRSSFELESEGRAVDTRHRIGPCLMRDDAPRLVFGHPSGV